MWSEEALLESSLRIEVATYNHMVAAPDGLAYSERFLSGFRSLVMLFIHLELIQFPFKLCQVYCLEVQSVCL